MRLRCAVLMLSLAYSAHATGECLKDGQEVSLEGRISRETFPGPPNYQSIDDGDQPETTWILTVLTSHCVVAESMEDGSPYEVAKSTTRFQLAFEDASLFKTHKDLVEHQAIVSGQLFVGHTGHHHTKALISVKTIKASSAE